MMPGSLWIVLGTCALMCSIGFIKFYYFLSVGYGLAIAGAGLAIIILFKNTLTPVMIVICSLLVLYGLRLSYFLLHREFKSKSYQKTLVKITNPNKPVPIFVKLVMWLCVSLMYMAQVSPVFYRGFNGDNGDIFAYIGAIVMILGLLIETVADQQKMKSKNNNPNRFCDSGLFKIVRCPNYFGELLFWSGVLIVGIKALQGIQWILALIGYCLIFYVMLSGAKRLENRQNKNYGKDPEYQIYVKKTPILFPFIPLYHLKNVKFIIE